MVPVLVKPNSSATCSKPIIGLSPSAVRTCTPPFNAILKLSTSDETELLTNHYEIDNQTGIYQLKAEFR